MSTPDRPPLAGKRALVTGAGRGIGHAIALALARAGADLALTARSRPELDAAATAIADLGRRALVVPCDVTDTEQVARLAGAVLDAHDGLGGLDILVNNAGASGSHKFLGHPDELWHRMLAVNLTSAYYVIKAFAPALVAQRSGRIIVVASDAARVGSRYIAAYTASKHGVLGLTRALAAELVEHNVTVNAICPGYVDTPMTDANVANMVALTGMTADQVRRRLEGTSPQRRMVAPEEVASVAVFLALDASQSITGQAINVDGGSVMS